MKEIAAAVEIKNFKDFLLFIRRELKPKGKIFTPFTSSLFLSSFWEPASSSSVWQKDWVLSPTFPRNSLGGYGSDLT